MSEATANSTSACVVVFGTVSLQRYIFRSNRLKENIGASYLAKHWLDEGLVEAIRRAKFEVDRTTWDYYKKHPNKKTPGAAREAVEVEVIYVGGGNAALLCRDRDVARKAVKAWSRELLVNAPGLRVAVGYGDNHSSLAVAYREALNDLSRYEEGLPFGAALYGLPVVRACSSTGLPASVRSSEEGEWISQTAARKRAQVDTEDKPSCAQQAITDEFRCVLQKGQRFAIELDKLGGREGQSHIAVVHADGNGMGERLNKVIGEASGADEEFLHNLRAFSASVSHLSKHALNETLGYLQAALPLEPLRHHENVFPLRPIVYGGDDLTFVCDGRLGLDLAARYLQAFSKGKIRILGEDEYVDACAGVAVVPTKFPFARAYDFAEELCGEAKSHRRQQSDPTGSWLDFQVIPEGATLPIQALRRAQYRSLTGQRLHGRPYQVSEGWDSFVEILRAFQSQWPRSRAKGLLQALTQGPVATDRFIRGAQWRGMKLPDTGGIDENAIQAGWTGGDELDRTTPYFDPLEVLDFYLEGGPATAATDAPGDAEEGAE